MPAEIETKRLGMQSGSMAAASKLKLFPNLLREHNRTSLNSGPHFFYLLQPPSRPGRHADLISSRGPPARRARPQAERRDGGEAGGRGGHRPGRAGRGAPRAGRAAGSARVGPRGAPRTEARWEVAQQILKRGHESFTKESPSTTRPSRFSHFAHPCSACRASSSSPAAWPERRVPRRTPRARSQNEPGHRSDERPSHQICSPQGRACRPRSTKGVRGGGVAAAVHAARAGSRGACVPPAPPTAGGPAPSGMRPSRRAWFLEEAVARRSAGREER